MPRGIKYLLNVVLSCFILQATLACKILSEAGDTRFVTFVHEEKKPDIRAQAWHDDKYSRLLINKIFEPQWRIVYNIAEQCNDQEAKTNIVKAIRQAIQQWLHPLRRVAHQELVAEFVFNELVAYNRPEDDERKFSETDTEQIDPHLQIIFYCEKGRSYAYGWHSEIHMQTVKTKHMLIENTSYHRPTLLHEIGHAFGLADTYVEEDENFRRFGITSSGALDFTVGKQPFSVMSGLAYEDRDPDQHVMLGKDDIDGIRWLYRYFHEKNTDTDTCPERDYELEIINAAKNISGCRPRYPLIFEIKQGHVKSASWIIQHALDVEINAQDQDGNTALHYAALHGHCDVVRDLLDKSHLYKDAVNNSGYTALQHAEQGGHHRIAALLRGEKGARCQASKSLCATIALASTSNLLLLVVLMLPALLCSRLRRKHTQA